MKDDDFIASCQKVCQAAWAKEQGPLTHTETQQTAKKPPSPGDGGGPCRLSAAVETARARPGWLSFAECPDSSGLKRVWRVRDALRIRKEGMGPPSTAQGGGTEQEGPTFATGWCRDRVSAAVDAVRRTPAADVAADAYANATKELGKIIGGEASHTVSTKSVVKQFQDAGYAVEALDCIHDLDLEEIDSVARWNRIRYGHSGTAALSGVASAAAITGAELLVVGETVEDKGAKDAPSFGVVAAAFAADIAVVLGLAARTVASTAQYYGYDPRQPEEQVFMMSVLGLGMAAGTPPRPPPTPTCRS